MVDKLKILRKAKGWSQNKLSEVSGVSQTYISELEAGKSAPTLPVVKKLATALGVTVAELLEEPETKPTGTEGR